MSKAEEKANNACPINKGSGIDRVISMVNRKNGYIQGYMQAEKDLGWRSIHDSLPEDGEYVFVRSEGEYEDGTPMLIAVVRYDHELKKWVDYDDECWSADYWMPCPKIPEDKK